MICHTEGMNCLIHNIGVVMMLISTLPLWLIAIGTALSAITIAAKYFKSEVVLGIMIAVDTVLVSIILKTMIGCIILGTMGIAISSVF